MKTSHTPGPWTVESDQVFSDEKIVADCKWTKRDKEERWANSRLIAAAPDLLEALSRFITQEHGGNCALLNGMDHLGCTCSHNNYAMRKARAAIAKATGEA